MTLVACGSETTPKETTTETPKIIGIDSLTVDTTGWEHVNYGVKRIILKKGFGASVAMGDQITANYKGFFKNGSIFDQSGSKAFVFQLGTGVIPGWNIALNELTVGTKLQFFVPSEMAYADKKFGVVPANTDLMFEVEILEVINQ